MTQYLPGKRSSDLFTRACKSIPGGVNSPVRAFKHVGGTPLFFDRGEGPYVYDADGRRYIDYVGSWGPLIYGHAPEFTAKIFTEAAKRGTSFGAPTEVEVLFAEELREILPSMDLVRCVSSGTEATMSAIRVARGYTGRKKLIKFSGCYHGHADSLLVQAGSGVATLGIPGSPGVPEELAALTLSLEFNDLSLIEKTLKAAGPETVAAIIIEPVAGNMGLVLPVKDYLKGIRELCDKFGIVLIFDEVMTGFRVALGGAQARYGIAPDMTTLGKVIGGGLPVGAFGGRREIMDSLAPVGPVYQGGTLSGNPVALSVGLEILRRLKQENPYPLLEERAAQLVTGLVESGKKAGVPLCAVACGSMLGFFFRETLPHNFSEVEKSNVERFKRFFHGMLAEGIYLAPSAFESCFLSVAHSEQVISQTITAAAKVLKTL